MVDAQFTEDEQVEKLKRWWKDNGTSLIVGVGIGLAAVVGYNYWQSSKIRHAETASSLYEQMMIQHQEGELETATRIGGNLMDDYDSSPYGAMGGLFMARISADKSDFASAASQLAWVIENADDPSFVHTARLRLADVHLQQGEASAAQSLIDGIDYGSFESQYNELRGDVLVQLERYDDALGAYQSSMTQLPAGSGYRDILTLKINNLPVSNVDTNTDESSKDEKKQ